MGLILPPSISRRRLLLGAGLSGAGLLLNGCGTSLGVRQVGKLSEPLNQAIEQLLLSQNPVPEFSSSAIEPDKLLINSFNGTPEIDPAQFRLVVNGEVAQPMEFSLADLKALPQKDMVIRHVCVEGWAAIVQWGGVQLQTLAQLVQPKPEARYVFFTSADGYYESWDLASSLHPQTLMVYEKNGQPLSPQNGAPLRLASPIKLGYKQSKWVSQITFMNALTPRLGYWEDRGYEWFAGL